MTRLARWTLTIALPPLLTFAVVLVAWQAVTVLAKVPAFLVPRPTAVWQAAVVHHTDLWGATLRTAGAALCGLALSIVAGILVGIVFSQSGMVRRSLYPYAIFLQTVPSVALAPLVILWFGPGLASVVVVAFIISLFPIITNATAGLLAVDRHQLELFEMANATRLQTLFKLRLPNATAYLVTGAKISSGLAVIGAIVGEVFASYGTDEFGLGYLIMQTSGQSKTDYLFAAVLASMFLGIAVFAAVSLAGELILRRWYAPGDPVDPL